MTGRRTDMIIAGRVHIYPAEIEAALRRHSAIVDAAVVGCPDPGLGETVVAYLETVPGVEVSAAELAAHAARHLASFKRPRRYTFLESLPRNAMGKVLKNELRALPTTGGQ